MATRVRLSLALVSRFRCASGRRQAFLWDATAPGLAVRATENGSIAYVFQGRHQGKSLRMTIGSPSVWSLTEAQEIARDLQRQIEEGRDPRSAKKLGLSA